MTHRDYVLAQINHEETEYIPYHIRLGRKASDALTAHYGSEDWKKNILWSIEGSPAFFDSWNTFKRLDPNDPTLFYDAYGAHWKHAGLPHLEKPAMDGIDPRDYKWPTMEDFFDDEKKAVMQKWLDNLPTDKFTLINIGAGHWELMWRLLGVEEALMLTIDDPELFDELIGHLDVLINQFMDYFLDKPGDAFYICDDWCDQRTCMFSIETWRRHIKPRIARLYKKAHDAGKLVVQHVCGNVEPLMQDLVEIGLDVLESVQSEAMDVYKVKKLYGDKITFFGALGVQDTVNFGTPNQIRAEIRRLRRELGVGGGFILAPAKALDGEQPIENLAAIYETFVEENHKFIY
ncbi:MAG: hypothetical protein IJN63_01375 [Clostridia bacterium]|nr:hypothetical protein [Clostridia bacterium]